MKTAVPAHDSPASEVAIGGYSPVSYFVVGRAEPGSPAHAVAHNGKVYHLTTAHQAELFRAEPDRYLPEHDGMCAYGMSVGKSLPVDPESFKIVDGRLLLFLRNDEVDARQLWEQGQPSSCSTDSGSSSAC